jgi:porphobilinogen synthase
VRQTSVGVDNLVYPLFVCPGTGVKEPIASLTGRFHFSSDKIAEEARNIDQIKKAAPQLAVITDVCLCAYTDHGHCGLIKDGRIDNDSSLEALAKMAVAHARAGADMVAPSDMMDGRVLWIRQARDAENFKETAIMSYSAKFASAFYGPFRDAASSAPGFGDRRGYQMDPASGSQAVREIALDIEEGADIVMVKPAMTYLDIIRQPKTLTMSYRRVSCSGEYMISGGC